MFVTCIAILLNWNTKEGIHIEKKKKVKSSKMIPYFSP